VLVEELLDLQQIGMSISPGFAPEPEQSTLAIITHHPDATYFGMKSGTLPSNDRQRADDAIAGSDRDPTRLTELPDEDPDDVGEAQAVTADAS
jgi:5-methyltetrahydrofolate--homocysteine methyltransferase